jgi:hypothetical protein
LKGRKKEVSHETVAEESSMKFGPADEFGLRLGKPGKLSHIRLKSEFGRWLDESVENKPRKPKKKKGFSSVVKGQMSIISQVRGHIEGPVKQKNTSPTKQARLKFPQTLKRIL